MNPVPILPARLDWPSAIGNFLLNFGTLEYFVFVFLEDHLSFDEFISFKKQHINERLDRIAQVLQQENHSAEALAEFARLRDRLKPMRELRNHLAHGHMFISLDPTTQKPTVTLVKAKDLDTWSMAGSENVEFAELEKALTTLRDLVEDFRRLAGIEPRIHITVSTDLKK